MYENYFAMRGNSFKYETTVLVSVVSIIGNNLVLVGYNVERQFLLDFGFEKVGRPSFHITSAYTLVNILKKYFSRHVSIF